MFLLNNWDRVKVVGWGSRNITVPLLIIATAISLSGITAGGTLQDKIAPLGAGLSFLALYLAARVLGKDIFLPVVIGVVVAALGIIAFQIRTPGVFTGGLVFEGNFDVATGFILLGAALFLHKWRWVLVSLAVVALLASGAPEAVFALGMLTLVVLVRRDWSRRMLVSVAVVLIAAIAGLVTGYGPKLYSYVADSLNFTPVAHYVSPEGVPTDMSTLEIRIRVIKDAMNNIKPLGDGFNLTAFRISTVHNVPLIIVQQLGYPGMIAGAAWLWIAVYCLVKTRWKYAWSLVLILSVFDHYIWTQIGPWFWALVGVSTAAAAEIRNDLIFRRK